MCHDGFPNYVGFDIRMVCDYNMYTCWCVWVRCLRSLDLVVYSPGTGYLMSRGRLGIPLLQGPLPATSGRSNTTTSVLLLQVKLYRGKKSATIKKEEGEGVSRCASHEC